MKLSVPPRLRAPVILSVASVAALAVGGATHGWSGLAYVLPIPVVVVTAFFVLGGRDTDSGALIRSERDERQAHERLRVQAVVGRVLSIAVAYEIAWATGATLWPWGAMLGVIAVAFIGGRRIYAAHGNSHGDPEVT